MEIFDKVRDDPIRNVEDSTVELENEFASPLGIEDSLNKKLTLSLISLPTTEAVERESFIEKLEEYENNLSAEKRKKELPVLKIFLKILEKCSSLRSFATHCNYIIPTSRGYRFQLLSRAMDVIDRSKHNEHFHL